MYYLVFEAIGSLKVKHEVIMRVAASATSADKLQVFLIWDMQTKFQLNLIIGSWDIIFYFAIKIDFWGPFYCLLPFLKFAAFCGAAF